jgi:hypothetical protein
VEEMHFNTSPWSKRQKESRRNAEGRSAECGMKIMIL